MTKPANISLIQGDLFVSVQNLTNDENKPAIIIPHVCNNLGAWGAGFVVPLGQHYPDAKESYLKCNKTLGHTDIASLPNNLFVANMIAQDGVGGKRPLRYDALTFCMHAVRAFATEKQAHIHAPLFGSGLAGGNWNFITQLILDVWGDLSVSIYYLPKDQELVANSKWE